MPITARLSRRFYEKFGDDIVNELVEWLNQVDLAFRSDLHQANENNFQRMEAKLEQRLAELGSEMRSQFADMNARLAAMNAAVDTKFAELKAELIKWMFLFWCGSVGLAVGAWLLK